MSKDHITQLTDDDSGEKSVLFIGDGTNGTRKYHFVKPDKTNLDLTGFDLRMRVKNAQGTADIVTEITLTITDATGGLAEADMTSVDITDTQEQVIQVFYNVVGAKNEVIRQKRVDVEDDLTTA